jgi:hypothetical protein
MSADASVVNSLYRPGQTVIIDSLSAGVIARKGVLVKLILEATPGTPELWDIEIDGRISDFWENEFEAA